MDYSYARRSWDPVAHVSVSVSPEASVRVIRPTVEAFDPAALHRLVLGIFLRAAERNVLRSPC
jgi:hypothetical protein